MTSVEPVAPKQADYVDPSLAPPPPYTQYAITTQPVTTIISHRPMFHLVPIRMVCNHCQADIVTAIDYRVGLITYIACGAIILLGFIAGCCLFPFCFAASKDAYHTCPNCKTVLGVYKRM